MSGQTIRWVMAFVATATLSVSLVVSAAKSPAAPVEAKVDKRDSSTVTDVELELILNKIREGDLLFQKKDLPGSRRAWQDARRMGEGLWPIHEGLGDSYARARMFDEALAEYAVAVSLVSEKHAAMRVAIGAKKASTIAASGRALEAIQAYLDLQQTPTFGARIVQLALDSDLPAAIRLIERHAEIHDARLFRLVSALESKVGRKAEAAEALGKFATRVAPWDGAMNRQAIDALRAAGRFDSAVEVCRAWVRSVPEAIDGYQLMGDMLWDAGRKNDALVAYSSIVAVKPGDAQSHRRLGEIYLMREQGDEALVQFERALSLSPNDAGLKARIVPAQLVKLEKLKAEGKREEARALRKRLAELNIEAAGLYDLKVVITWDSMSDVDLDVIEPDGVKINHGNRESKVGGKYFEDNTRGLGPETYTLLKAKPGKWRVGAHLHAGTKSTVKIVVILFEDTPQEERREETIVLEAVGESPTFIRDIVIE